ncbi:MAG: hypothetical protein H6551_08485 [Chitinophagales bacterium]|nr:hypothetical protein [Chitinophagaceae bacterium]MCB9065160.1 hypothetical protein [Chitinophagales bacterium]
MKHEHQVFINHLLKTGDKYKAYKAAYPNASGEALQVSARRLMNHPDIQGRMKEALGEVEEKVKEEVIADTKEALQSELASIEQKRKLLAKMISGEYKVKRQIRVKDRIEEVEEDLNPYAMLRAIELDTKLAKDWYDKVGDKPKEQTQPPRPAGITNMPFWEPLKWSYIKYKEDCRKEEEEKEAKKAREEVLANKIHTPSPRTEQNVTKQNNNAQTPQADKKPNDKKQKYKPNTGYTISMSGAMKFPNINKNRDP